MKKIAAIFALLVVLVLSAACYFEFRSSASPGSTVPVTTAAPPTAQVTPIDPSWKSQAPADVAPVLLSIADVVEKMDPSVVTITTEQYVSDVFSRQIAQQGAASGWILDSKGIIVTNNHVVEGAGKILIQFADGRTFESNSNNVFRDQLTDLAIIKVNLAGLTPAATGDSSKLRVGDWVVAIGNPLGHGIRAKQGTVSGLNVSLSVNEQESLYDLIETSAAINPGNSGGPLVNMKGEIVGITSAKIAEVGVQGMGYAININSAMPILQELITKGYVTRPFLGAELATVTDYIAYYDGLAVDHGAVVTYVQPGSPAAQAGLRKLDVIVKYQDKDINTSSELLSELRNAQIGQAVTLIYVRGRATLTSTVKLTKTPPPQ